MQLDLIFAIAYNEGKNPVAVSRSGNIPEAGTIEAERALGREPNPKSIHGQEGPRRRRLSNVSDNLRRAVSGGGEKNAKSEQRFNENAEKQV